jgi:calcium channel MID1
LRVRAGEDRCGVRSCWQQSRVRESGMLFRGLTLSPVAILTSRPPPSPRSITADFPCPLAYQLDLCPSIAYAAAINTNSDNPVTTLPDALHDTLVASLNAFSTSVSSTACGRDLYSPVSSCYDCFNEYREWLCRMIIPQCADTGTSSSSSSDNIQPLTIQRTPSNPRTNFTSTPTYTYNELLPCLSICRRADRTCPAFLGFKCPQRTVNGNESYGFRSVPQHGGAEGYGEGEEDGGVDEWGNRWCNGLVAEGGSM